MEPIGNTVQIQGDFTEENIQTEIKKHIKDKIDVVMSDMCRDDTRSVGIHGYPYMVQAG